MGKRAFTHRVLAAFISVATLALLGGCTQPVKDKAHDLSNAFTGNYDAQVSAHPLDIIAAAQGAVQDLHLILISQNKQQGDATAIVIARSPADEKVTVTVYPEANGATRFTVTTGVFGNSVLRQQVMDAIKLRLGNAVVRPTTQP